MLKIKIRSMETVEKPKMALASGWYQSGSGLGLRVSPGRSTLAKREFPQITSASTTPDLPAIVSQQQRKIATSTFNESPFYGSRLLWREMS